MDAATVRERAGELPGGPGVYQFLDGGGTILYVGKAVELPDRVRSYADPRSERIRRMRARATAIDFAVTETETQALLLEANLIKRHQPTYNVRLKDDKSYPLVQLTDHAVPRIEITRDPDEAATVYGPYTDKGRLDVVVKALRQLYGIRGCSDHKFSNRDRPCLDHDIGLCSAPCTGEITRERYRDEIESVKRFFEGERGILAEPLRQAMEEASQNQQFERAANIRDRLNAVESFHGEGGEAIHARDERTMDVLGVAGRTVARLHSENGSLTERECRTLDGPEQNENETAPSAASVLSAFVPQYYTDRKLPDVLLISERPNDREVLTWLEGEGVDVRVPGAGREATLIDLALKNARRGIGTDRREKAAVTALTELLGIDSIERIEGFDVSHAQGRAVVGSNVVFADGQPEKGSYRRKKLSERNDDYANMHELLDWRATRSMEGRDDRPTPDLLLIDGGAGQLKAAMAGFGEWGVPAIAIAKGDDGDRIITPERTIESCDEQALRLLQRVRDEAHRFAVQYHQTVRDDVSTVLDEVEGIGPKTRANLLRRFGSIENVRAASLTELKSVPGVGEKTATTLDRRL